MVFWLSDAEPNKVSSNSPSLFNPHLTLPCICSSWSGSLEATTAAVGVVTCQAADRAAMVLAAAQEAMERLGALMVLRWVGLVVVLC